MGGGIEGGEKSYSPHPPLPTKGYQNNLITASGQMGQVQFTTIFFIGGDTNAFLGIVKLIQTQSIVE